MGRVVPGYTYMYIDETAVIVTEYNHLITAHVYSYTVHVPLTRCLVHLVSAIVGFRSGGSNSSWSGQIYHIDI